MSLDLNDLKRQLVAQLVESSRLLRNYIDHRAKDRGTTRAQWIVLFRLREQEGLSQVDLADVLELQPISLVRLLDRLVGQGLLERHQDPKDRRANRLFLTASGRQFVVIAAGGHPSLHTRIGSELVAYVLPR